MKIQTELSAPAAAYFQDVAQSLQGDAPGGEATAEEVVNYVFETLRTLEQIIGDPADFIQGVQARKILVTPIPEKPYVTTSPEKNKPNKTEYLKRYAIGSHLNLIKKTS